MRLLHQRHDHDGKALLDRNPQPTEADVRAGARRQSLPLRHPQPHRPRRPARRAGEGEDLTMNAPTLTRRDFTKGLGGIVLAFALDPRGAGPGQPPRGCPAASTPTACSTPGSHQRRRHRHGVHRQGRAGAGHPDRARADRGRGARSAARARQDDLRRHRPHARTRGRPPAASRSRTAARRCAWPAPRCARSCSSSPRHEARRCRARFAERRRRRHQPRGRPQGHLWRARRRSRPQARGDRQGRAEARRRSTRSSASRSPRLDIPAKVTGGAAYVQDVRLPGMVHGRVVRPPRYGATLESVDEAQVQGDAGRDRGGARRQLPRRGRRARGAGDQGARGARRRRRSGRPGRSCPIRRSSTSS